MPTNVPHLAPHTSPIPPPMATRHHHLQPKNHSPACLNLQMAERTYYVHILAVSNVADLMQATAVVPLSAPASQLAQVIKLLQSMLMRQVNWLSRAPEFLKPKL
jgi:hypothetical protein